jgi:hypothetical protein
MKSYIKQEFKEETQSLCAEIKVRSQSESMSREDKAQFKQDMQNLYAEIKSITLKEFSSQKEIQDLYMEIEAIFWDFFEKA